MKIAILNSAVINSNFGEVDTDDRHFKERCYFLVNDDYDFVAESATEIVGQEAIDWIEELLILGREADPSLAEYKKLKRKAINKRTGELIDGGFEYPASSGNIFSLSSIGQSNLHGLKANVATTPYPFPWATIDDESEYLIADQADAEAFYGVAFTIVVTHRQAGNTLKRTVNLATTKAEVDAVIDNR